MRVRRARAWLLAGSLAVVAGPAATGVAAPGDPRCGGGVVRREDGWTAILAPEFPAGPAYLTAYALDPRDARLLFVTNGRSIMRSSDGGCVWQAVYRVAADPRGESAEPTIGQLGTTGAAGRALVYLTLTSRGPAGAAVAPTVVVSEDGGATWVEANRGLPPLGTVTRLVFAADGRRGYALVQPTAPTPTVGDVLQPVATGPILYTTGDRGDTWTPAAGQDRPALTGLLPGAAPGELWAWTGTAFYHSTDAGQTLAAVSGVSGDVTAVAAALQPSGAPAPVPPVVLTPSGAWISPDGRAWRARALPGRLESGSYAVADGTLLGAGLSGAWVVPAYGKTFSVTPVGPEQLRDVTIAVQAGAREAYGLTRSALFHGLLGPGLGVLPVVPIRRLPQPPPVELVPGDGPLVGRPTLRPANLTVPLSIGERERVRYTLDLPPTPTPLDVFFLVDTTNSFQPLINGLRQQLAAIVNGLTAGRVDARFGVGAFREYPVASQSATSTGNYAYKLVRKIGPVDASLEEALYALRAADGTTDGRTSALAAAYQAATGAGQRVAPTDVSDGYLIPPGLDAGFRPGALKVMLLVTDTEPRQPELGYFGPSVAQVGGALAGRGIHLAGLVVGEPPDGIPGPLEVMEQLATMTDTLAPDGGLDCDADGVVDLDPGQPIVCALVGDGLAPAILELLRGVRDEAAVELAVSGDPLAVRPASALIYPVVNVKSYVRLRFDLAFSCPASLAGTVVPVRLTASSRGRTLTTAGAQVACALPAPPAVPVLPVPRPPVVALVAPVPPPPPPPNVPPNPNLNPNPNPQVNVNAQVGVAAQDDVQPQLALAGEAPPEETELAMSDLRQQGGAAAGVVLGGACVAAAAAAMHRRRIRLATEPVRR